MAHRPIFLDANLLSIFTELGRLELLMKLLHAHELHVSPAILNELSIAVKHGHTHVQAALALIGVGKPIQVTAPSADELSRLGNLPTWMASGEAEALLPVKSVVGSLPRSTARQSITVCVKKFSV